MGVFGLGKPDESPLAAGVPLMLSSANPDKVREIVEIFVVPGYFLVPRPNAMAEVDETGETLQDNALLKARAGARQVGHGAIADDTGLEVAALDGRPGVYSARFAGVGASYEDNVSLLLSQMDGVQDRRARFVTVAVAVLAGGREIIAEGVTEGHIAEYPRGTEGFGYDPIFVPDDGDGRTLAEMSAEDKHAVSHRGRAFRQLVAQLKPLR
jgi:XTP/dITP diphosphohydrolase